MLSTNTKNFIIFSINIIFIFTANVVIKLFTHNNILTLYNFHTNNGITFKLYYKKIAVYLFRIKIKNSLVVVNDYDLGRLVNALNARYSQYISYSLFT